MFLAPIAGFIGGDIKYQELDSGKKIARFRFGSNDRFRVSRGLFIRGPSRKKYQRPHQKKTPSRQSSQAAENQNATPLPRSSRTTQEEWEKPSKSPGISSKPTN